MLHGGQEICEGFGRATPLLPSPRCEECVMSSVWCRVCDIPCDIQCVMSSVWCRVCDVQGVISSVWYPVCDVTFSRSKRPHYNWQILFFWTNKCLIFKWQYRAGAGDKIMEKVEPELEQKLNNLGSATLPEFKLTNLWNLPKVLIKTSFLLQLKRDRCRTGAWI